MAARFIEAERNYDMMADDTLIVEYMTTKSVRDCSKQKRLQLREALWWIVQTGFPRTSAGDIKDCVEYVFTVPRNGAERNVILVKKSKKAGMEIIGLVVFEKRAVWNRGTSFSGIYVLLRVVSPRYHGTGLGYSLIARVLELWQPDLLMTTCAQSASLHSWSIFIERQKLFDFEVYPRVENRNGEETVFAFPYSEYASARDLFGQLYAGVVDDDANKLQEAVETLTPRMVRRNLYETLYDDHPWRKNGRRDAIADALGVTPGDGVLLVLRKRRAVVDER